jgi:hypothetical protein|tara:strand:- start:238 stop:390 length:153 start_codon:yes stop_codon:yes gene_type:complete
MKSSLIGIELKDDFKIYLQETEISLKDIKMKKNKLNKLKLAQYFIEHQIL